MLRDKKSECKLNPDPTARPDYTEADVQALRAMWDGVATERQQKQALEWLLFASGKDDRSFRPESERLSNFAEGRRQMGLNIVYMLKAAPTKTDPDKIATRRSMFTKGEQSE